MPPDLNRISADLCPPIFDGDDIAHVRVAGFASSSQALGVERGVVEVDLIEDLRPRALPAGSRASFAFARAADPMARAFARADAWNTLNLDAGAELLVAWRVIVGSDGKAPSEQGKSGTRLYALTAAASLPAADPAQAQLVLKEVRESVAIHALPRESAEREPRLLEAILGGRDTLRAYALAAVGPRAQVPRARGVDLLVRAIESDKSDEATDIALADPLSDGPLYAAEKGADAENVRILRLLGKRFLKADASHAGLWLRYLSNCTMIELDEDADEDQAKRAKLLRAIGGSSDAMEARLTQLIAAGDPDAELIAAFKDAWTASR